MMGGTVSEDALLVGVAEDSTPAFQSRDDVDKEDERTDS